VQKTWGTPLHKVVHKKYQPAIRILLQHTAHVNALDSEGSTPLDIAMRPFEPLKGGLNTRKKQARRLKSLKDASVIASMLLNAGGKVTDTCYEEIRRWNVGREIEELRDKLRNEDILINDQLLDLPKLGMSWWQRIVKSVT